MNGKSKYIVTDILGYYLDEAESASKAWAIHNTRTTGLDDVIAFDKRELREWLIANNYRTIAKTSLDGVYAIS